MHIYVADLHLWEHTYFASREIGSYYETEPLIGNYALTYALGWCKGKGVQYHLAKEDNRPQYADDLAPLNKLGIYLTPAGFDKLRLALTRFNGQIDSYYFRFAQNAITDIHDLTAKVSAVNYPQSGRIRMLGLDSTARFYLLDRDERIVAGERLGTGDSPTLPPYIRLGKFMSKARVRWSKPYQARVEDNKPIFAASGLLNGADLPDTSALLTFSTYNIHPAPILRDVQMRGQFWQFTPPGEKQICLPTGLRYGVG